MTAAFLDRRIRLAVWSARLGALAVPVLVIAALAHHAGIVDTASVYGSLALGFSLAVLAVVTAVAAFATLWRYGGGGIAAAARGLVVGLVVLALPAVAAWKIVAYPPLSDVSTTPERPPMFVRAVEDRGPGDAAIGDPDAERIALQREAYPDIVPRHYGVTPGRVFQEAAAIVAARGWTVLELRPPGDAGGVGRIETVAATLLFAFRQDIVIEIGPDRDGTLVEMRSASRSAVHDLGVNAARIRALFADLDEALRGVAG